MCGFFIYINWCIVSGMKVLIATGLYPPEMGGPATYSKLLVDYLPNEGIEVQVLPFSSVRSLPKIIRHLAYCWHVYRQAKKVDVVFAQDAVSVGLASFIVARILKKPFILRVPGDYAWEQGVARFDVSDTLDDFVTKSSYALPVRVLSFIQSYVAKRSNFIIVPSEYLKKIVLTWGVTETKIHTVHNAFSPKDNFKNLITTERIVLRTALELPSPLVLSVGRLVPWKGFSALIETMPELIKTYPTIMLVIIGEGQDREYLQRKIDILRLNSNIMLMGALSKDRLYRYVRAADVFVLNTNYEGLSHQLLEVMNLKTPIITTGVGGNPELITHNETGSVVAYNNKTELHREVRRVLDDTQLAQKYIENATTKVSTFTVENLIGGTIEVLRKSTGQE